jgi:hypothetical protein
MFVKRFLHACVISIITLYFYPLLIMYMCWNKDISLNTFLFSSFVLLLIFYNNEFTQYKIKEFYNIWVYLFFISFILMQLIEYFIWVNINNPILNKIFTSFAILLLFAQPIASGMLISNNIVRSNFMYFYLIFSIPLLIYKFITNNIHSSLTPYKHLHWNFAFINDSTINKLLRSIWIGFFLFPLFYERLLFAFLFGILTLAVIFYNYYKDNSVGSMWCWVVNSIMIYYAGYLLLYLPFFK